MSFWLSLMPLRTSMSVSVRYPTRGTITRAVVTRVSSPKMTEPVVTLQQQQLLMIIAALISAWSCRNLTG